MNTKQTQQPASVAAAITNALGDLNARPTTRQELAAVLARAEALEALFLVVVDAATSGVDRADIRSALRRVRDAS